ncbi:hypothetical protein HP532_01915 [Pseudomonas sp. CrR25]|nr:hypothetical protein [Pseudomonas sp. CrR25]
MKSLTSTTVFSGLLLILAGTVSGHAVAAPVAPVDSASALMLAESGSDRLADYRITQEQRFQMRQDEGQRFVQMLERKPTAAGPLFELEDAQSNTPPVQQYRSPIHRDRVEHGWH